MKATLLACLLALAAAIPAAAHDVTKNGIMVIHPMSRPVMAGRTGAAYMAIANEGEAADRLLGASSPAFQAAELHESYDEGGVTKMRRVEVLDLPAGATALLEPGRLHLMLIGAGEAFAEGAEFPLVLTFENAGEIEIPVMVGAPGDAPAMDHSGHGNHAAPARP